MSPTLSKQFKPYVKNCILDGEMMCYNTSYKSFTTKGDIISVNNNFNSFVLMMLLLINIILAMNIDVKKLRIGNTHQPCFCVFDVLYYNDKVLTSLTLEKRLDILSTIFEPLEGIFIHTTRHRAKK